MILSLLTLPWFVLFTTIKRDGYFPLNEASPLWQVIILDLLFVAITFFCIWFVFKQKPKRISENIAKWFAIGTLNVFIVGTLLLIWHSAKPFTEIYQVNMPLLYGVLVLCLLIVNLPWIFKKPKFMIPGLFIVTIILYGFGMITVPISAKLADLMPIVVDQGKAFLAGQSIYQYFPLDNGVATQAVRQPGVMLSYLPAVALNIDARVMSLIYQLGGGLLLLEIAYPKFKKIVIGKKLYITLIALAVFLILPYRAARTDLYDPPYWFLLIASLWALVRQKNLLWAVLNGLAISTQIWSWIMLPFFLLYLFKQKIGIKKILLLSFTTLIIGAGILAVFILPNPGAYYEHVFGFYDKSMANVNGYPAMTVFLTPVVYALGLAKILRFIQFGFCAITGLYALFKLKRIKSLIFCLCLVTFFFIQFNIISWTYMYLIIIYLIVFYTLLRPVK